MSNHATGPPALLKAYLDGLGKISVCVVGSLIVVILLRLVAPFQVAEQRLNGVNFHPNPKQEVKALVIQNDKDKSYRGLHHVQSIRN